MVIYWVFSGLYFPAFGTEKTPYLDTFHAVINCSTWALETSWPLETILGPTHSKFGAVYLIQSPKIGQILWKKNNSESHNSKIPICIKIGPEARAANKKLCDQSV